MGVPGMHLHPRRVWPTLLIVDVSLHVVALSLALHNTVKLLDKKLLDGTT
jgi:hypothetical protein